MSDPFSIESKRTLITGGAAGIGLGVATHFVGSGAVVTIADLAENGASIAAGIGADFVHMDVTDPRSVADGIAASEKAMDGLDVLVLNAGIDLEIGTAGEFDLSAFAKVMDVNFGGVVHGLSAGPPLMGEGGAIIITSSPAGRLTLAGLGAYSASKAAVDSITRTAAIELAEKGIRVNAVLPGIARTDMQGGATGEASDLALITATGIERNPSELAPVYHFLASEASATMTGAAVQADDGMTAGFSSLLLGRALG